MSSQPPSSQQPPRTSVNRGAIARLTAVRPAWTAVRTAREALGLPDRTLLHAGPPFIDPRRPSAPVLSSAVLCCLYEGWAADAAEAERLIADGAVRLEPAQHYGAVAPLAAVFSPSTTLVEVTDLAADGESGRSWSLLGSGAGPQLRFGSRDPAILPRLAWRDGHLAGVLARVLAEAPIHLLPLAVSGVAGGDDLHGRTTAATQALVSHLEPRLDDAEALAMLRGTPLFFLTLWMAACHLMLSAAARDAGDSTLVVALAGNGQRCGIRLAGRPGLWFTADAAPPQGPRLDPAVEAETSPMIGDSGAIDAAGFGGHALRCSPEVASALAPWLPADALDRPAALLSGVHPAFAPFGLRTALDAAAVTPDAPPLAAIAMLDAAGERGLLGRGLYVAPPALFQAAAAGRISPATAAAFPAGCSGAPDAAPPAR
ncbi:DUF1116 domain-containing protein [Pigmentiphaga soli]|uniref:DUF1116 domain-containing protein n=1 Tax=Pigmentiphaga soli TaxID=1007095 RepID=A0ABP8HJ67_9BURK